MPCRYLSPSSTTSRSQPKLLPFRHSARESQTCARAALTGSPPQSSGSDSRRALLADTVDDPWSSVSMQTLHAQLDQAVPDTQSEPLSAAPRSQSLLSAVDDVPATVLSEAEIEGALRELSFHTSLLPLAASRTVHVDDSESEDNESWSCAGVGAPLWSNGSCQGLQTSSFHRILQAWPGAFPSQWA